MRLPLRRAESWRFTDLLNPPNRWDWISKASMDRSNRLLIWRGGDVLNTPSQIRTSSWRSIASIWSTVSLTSQPLRVCQQLHRPSGCRSWFGQFRAPFFSERSGRRAPSGSAIRSPNTRPRSSRHRVGSTLQSTEKSCLAAEPCRMPPWTGRRLNLHRLSSQTSCWLLLRLYCYRACHLHWNGSGFSLSTFVAPRSCAVQHDCRLLLTEARTRPGRFNTKACYDGKVQLSLTVGRTKEHTYCGRAKPRSEYIGASSSSTSKPGDVAMLGKLPTTK